MKERKTATHTAVARRGQKLSVRSTEAIMPIQTRTMRDREPLLIHSSVGAYQKRDAPANCFTACR
jgi:hypothetical protein